MDRIQKGKLLSMVFQYSKPQVEQILDSRVKKQMRHGMYMEHLIKWHTLPEAKATWVAESNFKRLGIDVALPPPGGT